MTPTVTDTAIYHIGDAYQTQEKAFTGYELQSNIGTPTGNFGEGDITVTYIYKNQTKMSLSSISMMLHKRHSKQINLRENQEINPTIQQQLH